MANKQSYTSGPTTAAGKVAEVFLIAGSAFGRLGELTLQLKMLESEDVNERWTDKELTQLKNALDRFSNDLGKITEITKTRTISQIREDLLDKGIVEVDADDETKYGLPKRPSNIVHVSAQSVKKRKDKEAKRVADEAKIVKKKPKLTKSPSTKKPSTSQAASISSKSQPRPVRQSTRNASAYTMSIEYEYDSFSDED